MYFDFQNYLSAAIESALISDVQSEDALSEIVRQHACLMAGINPDELLWHYGD